MTHRYTCDTQDTCVTHAKANFIVYIYLKKLLRFDF